MYTQGNTYTDNEHTCTEDACTYAHVQHRRLLTGLGYSFEARTNSLLCTIISWKNYDEERPCSKSSCVDTINPDMNALIYSNFTHYLRVRE